MTDDRLLSRVYEYVLYYRSINLAFITHPFLFESRIAKEHSLPKTIFIVPFVNFIVQYYVDSELILSSYKVILVGFIDLFSAR